MYLKRAEELRSVNLATTVYVRIFASCRIATELFLFMDSIYIFIFAFIHDKGNPVSTTLLDNGCNNKCFTEQRFNRGHNLFQCVSFDAARGEIFACSGVAFYAT